MCARAAARTTPPQWDEAPGPHLVAAMDCTDFTIEDFRFVWNFAFGPEEKPRFINIEVLVGSIS